MSVTLEKYFNVFSLVVTRDHSWSLVVVRGHSCVLLDTIFFVYLLSSLFFICFVVSFLFLSRTKVCFKLTSDTSGCPRNSSEIYADWLTWHNLVSRVFSFSNMAMSLWFGCLFSYCFSVLGIPGDPAWIPGSLPEKIAEILGVGGGGGGACMTGSTGMEILRDGRF